MQRLLTVETRRESQRTLAVTPLATLLTLAIYLGLGAALFAFYTQHGAPGIERNDEILPYFVGHTMPAVLRGLMLAVIVLASLVVARHRRNRGHDRDLARADPPLDRRR
jgi:solute:Na+ symporter, SSS family